MSKHRKKRTKTDKYANADVMQGKSTHGRSDKGLGYKDRVGIIKMREYTHEHFTMLSISVLEVRISRQPR